MTHRITGIGEVLWDLLPGGRQLGGAPANFTCHARSLGADATLVTRLGTDELGREALERLTALGLPCETLEVDPVLPTGTVGVEVAADGQPRFEIHRNVAWDALRGDGPGREAVERSDAVCFGTLGQRTEGARTAIRSLLAATRPEALRIFDVNLRSPFWSMAILEESLGLAGVLKLNETELPILASVLGRGPGPAGSAGLGGGTSAGVEERACLEALARRYRLQLVAYTRGARGSLLFREGEWSEHGGIPTRVVDAVGAGDAFTAAMTLGHLSGWPLDRINDFANRVAAFVCSQPGATPRLPDEFRRAFEPGAGS